MIFKRNELYLLHKVHFFTDSSFCVGSKISCIFDKEGVITYYSNRPCIIVYIFHPFDVFNHNKISSFKAMRRPCCYSPFLFICYVANANLWKLYSWIKHFPFFTEVSRKQSKESKLQSIHNNCLWILLRSYKFINAHNSTNIVDIAKDDNIILQAIFFIDLSIKFIHVNFIIEAMA